MEAGRRFLDEVTGLGEFRAAARRAQVRCKQHGESRDCYTPRHRHPIRLRQDRAQNDGDEGMRSEALIVAGGVLTAAFVVFHLFFWKLFRWKTDPATLTSLNRAIVQILNLCLTFAFVVFAYISLVHPVELLTTDLGRSLLLLIAVFWYLRAAEQVLFFGLRRPISVMFFALFVVGGSLYAVPLL